MIVCPNCNSNQYQGAYFCNDCGTQLIPLEFLSTRVIKNEEKFDENQPHRDAIVRSQRNVLNMKDPEISLHLVESGKVIHLSDKKGFTLGRAVEGQTILPDVDLNPYDAFSEGVSRMHVSLRIANGDVFISDLGSSNGTKINGQKVAPHVEYRINHGDMIILGKLKIQVLLIK